MHSQIRKAIVVGLFFVQLVYSKNIITKDTLSLQIGKNSYSLSNNFIYPESVKITSNDFSSDLDSIDYINGIFYWDYNYEEPVFSFVPSIGISQIIDLENNFSKKIY